MKKYLNRRTFLRAVTASGVACLGLPTLEAMLNSDATAYADGAALPVRFGIWFWGNGIQKDTWVPSTQGPAWTVPTDWSLAPISERGLQASISVVSGMQLPHADEGQAPHVWGQTVLLSGQGPSWSAGLPAHFGGSTIDQTIAAQAGGASPIVVAINRRPSDNATLVEPSLSWVSTSGPAQATAITPQLDPAALFAEIFGAALRVPAENRAKASVLDTVAAQIKGLEPRVAMADRARLESHFTALRELERGLTDATPLCGTAPDNLTGLDPKDATNAGMRARHDAMTRVIALALACNARTTFSLSFSGAGDQTPMPGQTNHPGEGLHALCHNSFQDPTGPDYKPSQADVQAAVRYQIDRFADLVAYFSKYPDLNGTLLDSCAILGTTELWDGNTHSYAQQPVLVAGRARGKLAPGAHIASTGNPCKVVLSLYRAATGSPVPSYGEGDFRVTEGLTALEA